MTPLDELLAATAHLRDAAAFERQHAEPALSLRVPAGDAPAAGAPVKLNDTLDDDGFKRLFASPLDRTHVAFLRKSERNPFGNIVSLGRAATNDVCVPHPSVSKVHAVFMRVGQGWKVADRGAKNGLFVQRVPVETGATAAVEDGALLGFGTVVEATFHLPAGLFQYLELVRRVRAGA